MQQPPSSLTGVAAALALLSGVAEAAMSVYTFNPVHVSDRQAPTYFATIDPMNPSVVSSSPSGGIFYFCLQADLSNVYIVDTGEYDMLFMPTDSFRVDRLAADYEIGAGTIGTTNGVAMIDASDYAFDERFFVGFALRESGSSDPYHYGWVEVSFAADGDLSIYRIGYETEAGVSATTGAVPEPSSALLAATGLLALVGRRKR